MSSGKAIETLADGINLLLTNGIGYLDVDVVHSVGLVIMETRTDRHRG